MKATTCKRLADNDLRRVLDTKRRRVSVTSTMTSPPHVASSSSSDGVQSSYVSPASTPPCDFSPASPPPGDFSLESPPLIPFTQTNEEEEVILVRQSPSSSPSSSASYLSPLPVQCMEPAACVILIEEGVTNLIMSTRHKSRMSLDEVTKGVCRTISHAISTPRWLTYIKDVFSSWEEIM